MAYAYIKKDCISMAFCLVAAAFCILLKAEYKLYCLSNVEINSSVLETAWCLKWRQWL